MEAYTIATASPADWTEIASLLRASGLPLDGLEEHLDSTIIAREHGHLVGCAAIERHDVHGLLRSVAVAPTHRGGGVGQAMTAAAIALARRFRIQTLYLLTETAESFFERFAFERTTRSAVPDAVRQSAEFTTACPESATVMVLRLRLP